MSAIDLIKKRRTQYAIGKNIELSQSEVEELVRETVRETPSAFNSQSSRVVILFNDEHQKLWNIVKDSLRPLVPAEQFPTTEAKLDSFAAGAGTILFFEDEKVIEGLQEKFALYADKFPIFSQNSAGMAQFAVWTALADKNIGASLQHYNLSLMKRYVKTGTYQKAGVYLLKCHSVLTKLALMRKTIWMMLSASAYSRKLNSDTKKKRLREI